MWPSGAQLLGIKIWKNEIWQNDGFY